MEHCDEPIVQEFLKLDEPGITASIEVNPAPGGNSPDEECPMS
jgi:hypothetical protein